MTYTPPTMVTTLCKTIFILMILMVPEITSRRPIYNIAHMVNTIKEVDYYLDQGANAVEADIFFTPLGEAKSTYHGSPCDCFRICTFKEDFGDYLHYIRQITDPNEKNYRKELALLFLDLKVSDLPTHGKFRAGDSVADKLMRNLWTTERNESNLNVIISIGHTSDSPVVKGFTEALTSRQMEHLLDKVGWDIGLNDPLTRINKTWTELGVRRRRWQGDGSSNCLGFLQDRSRLKKAIVARDKNSTFEKIYHWTIDLTSALRTSLRQSVDGIITNHPERLVDILKEDEFRYQYRLAVPQDSPWERIKLWSTIDPPRTKRSMMFNFVENVAELCFSFTYYVNDAVRNFLRTLY